MNTNYLAERVSAGCLGSMRFFRRFQDSSIISSAISGISNDALGDRLHIHPGRDRQVLVAKENPGGCHMRRFTRLTNAFSKKIENHAYAVSLHTSCTTILCGFTKPLRVTPVMEAGVDDHVWSLEEVIEMADTV